MVGAGGVLGLRPSRRALCARGSGFALAARASPLRRALRARSSGFALAARAVHLQLGLCPRGSLYALAALHARGLCRLKKKNHTLYNFVLYNSYTNCMNWYKNHTVYEFVLYNLYNNCMNSFVRIRTKISKNKLYPGWDFNPASISRLQSSLCLPSTTPPPPSVAILFIYRAIIYGGAKPGPCAKPLPTSSKFSSTAASTESFTS